MAASLPADNEFAPTEFSPPRELVRIAVIVLAVAGVAGLWKGAVYAIEEGPVRAPPPQADNRKVKPVLAKPLPAVVNTADTLVPQGAAGSSPLPAPAPAAAEAPAPAAKPEPSVQAEPGPVVEAAKPVMEKAAPAAPLPPPIRRTTAEPAAPPLDDFDQPPPLEEEGFLLD